MYTTLKNISYLLRMAQCLSMVCVCVDQIMHDVLCTPCVCVLKDTCILLLWLVVDVIHMYEHHLSYIWCYWTDIIFIWFVMGITWSGSKLHRISLYFDYCLECSLWHNGCHINGLTCMCKVYNVFSSYLNNV